MRGVTGGETHFRVTLVSDQFQGKVGMHNSIKTWRKACPNHQLARMLNDLVSCSAP